MTGTRPLLKLALVGNTGVGKTTFVDTLKKKFKNIVLKEIKLATPLYRAQACVYRICKVKKSSYVQDGVLLNFLGQHMRSINEKVIEEHFISQFNKILNHAEIVICSDVRPRDFSFMKHHNFLFIHIEAEESLSLERRKKRGDISLANSKHWTEKQDSEFIPDYKITNNGSLEDYKLNVLNLVRKIYDSYR